MFSNLGRLNLSEIYLAGVADALKQHPQGEAKGIKAHFYMDESGLLNLTNVCMHVCMCLVCIVEEGGEWGGVHCTSMQRRKSALW